MADYKKVGITENGDVYFVMDRFNNAFRVEETVAEVIRPISEEDLESYRDIDTIIDNDMLTDEWKSAVDSDRTIMGLREFVEDILDELADEEDYPYKDESYCELLDELNVRGEVSDFLKDELDIDVATFEFSASLTLVFDGKTKESPKFIWEKEIK